MKSGRSPGVWTILALLLAAPVAMAATTLRKVELSAPGADSARLVLTLSGVPAQKVFALDNPQRIVIDLPATHLGAGVKLPPAAGPVRSVRSGTQSGKTLRLVVELTRQLAPNVSVNGSQLTIDLGAAPKPVADAPVPAVPVAVRAAHAPGDAGRDLIVAVDAGHGGPDPGASGRDGTREKNVVLAIAQALARRINAEPGMRAILTRDEDRFIVLRERMNMARRARADIFVSIHADAIKNRDVTGSSVYVLSDRGATSEAARWLAEQENAADLKGGVSLGDKSDSLASVLMDLSQTASIGASMEAAERVLGQLDRVGTVRKSKVQQAAFIVLKSPDIPSMLVETGYISNPAEEQKLRNPAHQAEVAEAVFNGVREYFRVSPPDGTLFARQRDARRGGGSILAGSSAP
ncbi:MAG: N-acetylmuramoyl-L-alanine amidase [Steroidobacteraceae bacterium]